MWSRGEDWSPPLDIAASTLMVLTMDLLQVLWDNTLVFDAWYRCIAMVIYRILPKSYTSLYIQSSLSNISINIGCKTYAIKRRIADEYIVRAAASFSTCSLHENTEITSAHFVQPTPTSTRGRLPFVYTFRLYLFWANIDGYYACVTGCWKVTALCDGTEKEYTAAMLFICDGSTSYLGM